MPYTAVSPSGKTLNADAGGSTYQWLDCNNANAVVAGETNQTFTPTANGNYSVIVTSGACSDTSACMTVINVGIIKDITESAVSIYPNPFNNRFTVQSDGVGDMILDVTDALGRIVYSKQVESNGNLMQVVDLSAEASGVYTLQIHSMNGGKVARKLVKQ